MSGPYGQSADAYWDVGWRGILPLPPKAKKNPPGGYTGAAGIWPSYPDVRTWADGPERHGNIALRMPLHVVGIDVDAYGDKPGADTLTIAESMHGALPATWRTTSRDDGVSGIRLYRVPEGLAWPGEIGPGTEIIQFGHRYALVWPSLHPEGRTYRWINPDGVVSTTIPDPDELPPLPETWIEAYTGGQLTTITSRVKLGHQQALAWLVGREHATGTMCARMGKGLEQLTAAVAGSAHNSARDAALRIARLADEGHHGAVHAAGAARAVFLADATNPERTLLGKQRRNQPEAVYEWNELIASAVGVVVANPTGVHTCDCYGQITGRILNTAAAAVSTPVDGSNALAPLTQPAPAHTDDTSPDPGSETSLTRMHNGAVFILDTPTDVPTIWGDGDDIIWAEGEALMIVGPPGVGKTTLCGQLLRARLGLGYPEVLGFPVAPTQARVLYLAMDRPSQIARALHRVFTERDRQALTDKLLVWRGPPPGDVARHPDVLTTLAQIACADTLIIDSVKDAAIGLSEDEVAAAYNRARQKALAENVQILELHHMVKRGAGGTKPTELADVYGSAWLTAGAGSVVLLWGAAGDPVVELRHLKQPVGEVGPFFVLHDHTTGTSTIQHETDLLLILGSTGDSGLTAAIAARSLFDCEDHPSRAQLEKARRKLDRLVEAGLADRFEVASGRGGKPVSTYFRTGHGAITEQSRAPLAEQPITTNHTNHADGQNRRSDDHGPITGNHAARAITLTPPSLEGGEVAPPPTTLFSTPKPPPPRTQP